MSILSSCATGVTLWNKGFKYIRYYPDKLQTIFQKCNINHLTRDIFCE